MTRDTFAAVHRSRASRSLELAVGIAFAIIGAEILVVPIRFVRSVVLPYGGLTAGLPAWGIAFIVVGAGLCAIGTVEAPRRAVLATSVCSAVLLCLLGALRLLAQAWADAALYGCTAVAIVAAVLMPGVAAPTWRDAGRRPGPATATAARAFIGLALIGLGLATSAVRDDWATTTLALGVGVTLVSGARLAPLQPLNFSSVRVRLVFMTVILTSGSLIVATLALAASAESTAIADAGADQRLTAGEIMNSLTQADSDYLNLVTTLAARGGFAALNADQQRAVLQGLTATNVYAFSTYDSAGQALARSDDRALQPMTRQMLMDLQQSGAAVHGLASVPDTGRPALVFAAAYLSSSGAVAGYATAELDLDQVSQALARIASVGRTGTSVFVLDSEGNVILHPPPSSPDAAAGPPDVGGSPTGGTLRYRQNGMDYVAAYTEIPSLGWSAISAYPIAYALTGVQNGRAWAFGLLVLSAGLSTVLSLFLAHNVVAPLTLLGNAMDDFAAEATATALPRFALAEVQRVAELFAAMRQRLVLRTADRQRALDSAREAVRVREEFMSIAAHELKTPVAAARGHAQLLLMQLRRGDQLEPARLRNSLERIDAQTRKLGRLIEQLLDVARLERGTLSIDPHAFDLRDLVPEALADRPERDRIRVQMPDEPVVVNADIGRLEQVVANLLDNASKFSPNDALIEVEVSVAAGATARLCVRDRGLGIPPEHREHIFERFHQAHADTHQSGFGLGLYIAKQIVELHAGSIRVDCPTSGGTRVSIDLPRVGAEG